MSTLDLQSTTIDNGSVINHSVLEATGGGTSIISNVADSLDATGEVFTNNGKLVVKDDGTTLILSNDKLENTFGSLSGKNGKVEVYARSDKYAAFVTLDLQSTTINNGSVINHSVLEVTGGGTSTISNVADPADLTGEVFTNNGKLVVKDDGTTLILSNDKLENTFGSLSGKNGKVEVYARSDKYAAFVTLDLQSTTINNGSVINHSVLEATGGGTSIISNVADSLDATGEVFTNNGKLVVKDDGTTLILSNDKLENTFGSLSGKNGKVEVYARSDKYAAFVTLDLQSTTINNGSVINHSVLEVTGGGTSTISNVADPADLTGEVFTNNGKLVVKDDGTTLILSNDTLNNTYGSISGKIGRIEVDANAKLYLQAVTINSYDGSHPGLYGAIYNSGLVAATAGDNYIHGADISNYTGATLEATGSGVTLTIDQNSTITNTGTLEATDNAKLVLDSVSVVNFVGPANGAVEADAGATLDLTNVTIFGGLVTGGGTIETIGAGSNTTFDGTTSALKIDFGTTVTVNDGTSLTLAGTINNYGSIVEMDLTGAQLKISGDVLLGGGGNVTLNASDSIVSNSVAATLHNVDNTISGAGTIGDGAGGSLVLSNSGAIEAYGASKTLILYTGNTIYNTGGILEASPGATLKLYDSVDGGSINANGGTIDFDPLTISNVTLSGYGGVIQTYGDNEFDNVIIACDTTVTVNGDSLALGGTFHNYGTLSDVGGTLDVQSAEIYNAATAPAGIELDGTSILKVDVDHGTGGTLKLTGGGTVTMASGSKVVGNGSESETLENVTNIIIGAGTIGAHDGKLTLQNDAGGTIDATGVLVFDTGNTISNAGTLEATGTGELDLKDGTISNAGTIGVYGSNSTLLVDSSGLALKGSGGQVSLTDGTITGKAGGDVLENFTNTIAGYGTISHLTLKNDAGGAIDADGGTLTLNTGHTISNAGTLEATGTGELDVKDHTISNTGTIGVYGSNSTLLVNSSGLALKGSGGEVVLTGGTIAGKSSSYIFENVTNTISGYGTISHLTLKNDVGGVIDATGLLILNTGHAIVNAGTLEATGTGELVIDDNIFGLGSLKIFDTATLKIVGSDFEPVKFASGSTGTLEIAQTIAPHSALFFGGQISGVTEHNRIDLADLKYDAGHMTVVPVIWFGNTTLITINNLTHQAAVLNIAGAHSTWSIYSDGPGGGTMLVDPPGEFGAVIGGTNAQIVSITNNNATIVDATGPLSIDSLSTLVISGATAQNVSFLNDGATAGELVLANSTDFTGQIAGFAGNGAAANSDSIDLMDINFNHLTETTFTENGAGTGGTLTLSDGMHTANIDFAGNFVLENFTLSDDGSGGVLIVDSSVQPASSGSTTAPGASVTDTGGTVTTATDTPAPDATTTAATGISDGTLTIKSAGGVEIDGASAKAVTFANNNGTTGELLLANSKHFTGKIIGFAGDGTTANSDLIDLRDINFANVAADKTAYIDNGDGTGTLMLYDAQGHVLASIAFVGSYELANFIVERDGDTGTLIIDPPVQSTGHDGMPGGSPDSGSLAIESGSTTAIGGASAQSVSFINNSGTTGALLLDDSKDFTGHIVGFAGDGTTANSDSIDLKDIDFNHLMQETYTANSAGSGGTLTLSDGMHTSNINFVGNYELENFKLSSDGSNGTLIIDPPVGSTVNSISVPKPHDHNGLFGGLSGAQSFSFNFDALHNPTSNLPNNSGNLDHLELKNTFHSEVDQLQSLLHSADDAPHDIFGHTGGAHTGVQLSHFHLHQDGLFHL